MTMVSGIVVCLRSAGMIIIGANFAPPRVPARGTPTISRSHPPRPCMVGVPLRDTTIEVEQ
jgi:hypothetical protein